jgi:hypothetical protein
MYSELLYLGQLHVAKIGIYNFQVLNISTEFYASLVGMFNYWAGCLADFHILRMKVARSVST